MTASHDSIRSLFAGHRSFLHHQIRNIAGTLRLVGAGKSTRADVARALTARDRSAAGETAPAEGLYFLSAEYEDG